MILVTAANGNQGKLLIPKLLAMKLPVRACVLTQASAQAMRAAGVNDVVVGDITDPALLAKAIKGVEKVYHVGPTMNPKEREMGIALVDAASANGIKHFSYSVRSCMPSPPTSSSTKSSRMSKSTNFPRVCNTPAGRPRQIQRASDWRSHLARCRAQDQG